ncbi:hypothetical protein Y032_1016g3398 [Ancylostoma ceylanicum]|uniref:Uncharacterized protein n=1 Tax=Ancylostoma ceylanicum TaxID=53326 RepID=A0A016W7P6_9BILA|nr:hypothetical protein Y032_1016g3398 [Ancylostoma ceylanicum]
MSRPPKNRSMHLFVEKINDACKKHDRCYSRKIQTRTECDRVFCDELDDLRSKYYGTNICMAPEAFCAAVIYGGHTA